jgi:hypothetical protein
MLLSCPGIGIRKGETISLPENQTNESMLGYTNQILSGYVLIWFIYILPHIPTHTYASPHLHTYT